MIFGILKQLLSDPGFMDKIMIIVPSLLMSFEYILNYCYAQKCYSQYNIPKYYFLKEYKIDYFKLVSIIIITVIISVGIGKWKDTASNFLFSIVIVFLCIMVLLGIISSNQTILAKKIYKAPSQFLIFSVAIYSIIVITSKVFKFNFLYLGLIILIIGLSIIAFFDTILIDLSRKSEYEIINYSNKQYIVLTKNDSNYICVKYKFDIKTKTLYLYTKLYYILSPDIAEIESKDFSNNNKNKFQVEVIT